MHCDLAELLLERALNNQHIGQHLFWELRAEMNSPTVGLLFGLILEAYLTAAPEHLRILEHQITLLHKCRAMQSALTAGVDSSTSLSYDKARARFEASLRFHFEGHHPYSDFVSPLNPENRCRRIKVDRCRLMRSKMRPQMITFQGGIGTADLSRCRSETSLTVVVSPFAGMGDDIVIMYKKGDDLRQDRLTLQLLKIMDLLWKESGLDFRMNIYHCTSTDFAEGFIEVVRDAETICHIQMEQADFKRTAVFRKGLLLSWLRLSVPLAMEAGHTPLSVSLLSLGRSHNPDGESILRAQQEFTQSCVGYTVAMYILGIGDRHNDNIMLKNNGQLFHIDFGHFLGNFKHKFGIR